MSALRSAPSYVISRPAWVVGCAVVAAAVVGASVAYAGGRATALLAAAAGIGLVVALRTLPLRVRLLAFGLVIGLGSLPFSFVGGGFPLVLAAAVVSIAPEPKDISSGSWPAKGLVFFSFLSVTASFALTAQTARVTLYVVATGIAIWTLAWWVFAPLPRARWSDPLWGVSIAGAVASFGVVTQFALGIEWVETSANMLANAQVGQGISRMRGFFTSPNESALVISAGLVAATIAITTRAPTALCVRWLLGSGFVLGLAALLMTGSRSSLLGLLAAGLVLSLPWLARRPARIVVLVLVLAAGWQAGQQLGTFSGRSLNVVSADDSAAEYRSDVRARLLSEIDWFALRGYGFEQGSVLAANPVLRNSGNVDQSWIYGQLSLGFLFSVGIASLLAGMILVRRTGAAWAVGAVIAWIAVTSSAENLVLLAPAWACAVLLLATARGRSAP